MKIHTTQLTVEQSDLLDHIDNLPRQGSHVKEPLEQL